MESLGEKFPVCEGSAEGSIRISKPETDLKEGGLEMAI